MQKLNIPNDTLFDMYDIFCPSFACSLSTLFVMHFYLVQCCWWGCNNAHARLGYVLKVASCKSNRMTGIWLNINQRDQWSCKRLSEDAALQWRKRMPRWLWSLREITSNAIGAYGNRTRDLPDCSLTVPLLLGRMFPSYDLVGKCSWRVVPKISFQTVPSFSNTSLTETLTYRHFDV